MPVTYSFTTTLTVPTSTDFPCWDFQSANMPTILLFPEVSQSRGAPWIEIDGDDDLVVSSNDGVLSWVDVDRSISNKFTLETNFVPSALPLDLSDLTQNRVFIGAFDDADNGGGVLLSRDGLAVVGEIPTSAVALPGSQNIIQEGSDYYTLRIAVNGDTDVMDIYITKTSELVTTGHVLRYTTAAPVTPALTPDHIRLEALGQAARNIQVGFDTLRLNCTEYISPNERPIADVGADQTTSLGSTVGYDGTGSYDPEGLPLSYAWALTEAPDGSRYKLTGIGGSTSDDGDADGFTDIFDGGTGAFSEDNAPTLQPGDHLVVDEVVYEVSTDRWTLNATTGLYERDGGWVDDELVITDDTLPDSLTGKAWKVLHSQTYFDDATESKPAGVPDVTGIYIVQLVVNDGALDSLPDVGLLNVSSTSIILGCVPDVSFIWAHIGDFWNFLEDPEKIETAWTGFAQAAAAQLLTLWQLDYNKSLVDTQRLFQRRWLNYSLWLEDDPETASISFVRGPIFTDDLAGGVNVDGLTLQLVLDAGDVQTIILSGASATAADIAAQINSALGLSGSPIASLATSGAKEFVKLDWATLLRIRPNGSANSVLGYSTTAYTQNDLQGTTGGIKFPGQTQAFVTTAFAIGSPPDYYGDGDPPVLDFVEEGIGAGNILVIDSTGYRVQKVAVQDAENRALTMLDALPDSGTAAPVTAPDRAAWLVPSVVTSTGINFASELVSAGDLASFNVKDLVNGGTVEVLCEVVGVAVKYLGFNPLPLLEKYAGVPSNYETTFEGVRRAKNVPVSELVMEVPRLQEIIHDPPTYLTENTDYSVTLVDTQPALQFEDGTFTINDPPPDTLWAELTYLDNNPTIENNFGRMVNFSVEQMEDRIDDLDYLSAVQGLWWSYFGGPAIDKVRTGVQILLGLPFAEAEGIVEEINETFSLTEGRFLIRDVADTSILRSYFYPRAAGVAINQLTGETIAVGDTVSQFAPLSGGIEVKDYKTDPEWLKPYVSHGKFTELDKFFRFLVRGDVDTFDLANMVFAIDFVKKIKPHYTQPFFVVLKEIAADSISVVDTIYIDVTMNLMDSICAGNIGAFRWDDTDGSGVIQQNYDDPAPQFVFDQMTLCPADSVTALIGATLPAGPWPYDSIWAWDDGGGTDLIPLSGPDSSPPAPYGPLVGTITFDASIAAGTYWRSKAL